MKFISASPAPDYQNGYCGISLNIKKGQEAVGEIYVKLKYLGKKSNKINKRTVQNKPAQGRFLSRNK